MDNIDIRELNIHWLRSQFGLVTQEPILFDMTIAQNIAYGVENPVLEEIIKAAKTANIHDFVTRLPQVAILVRLIHLQIRCLPSGFL